MRAGIFVVLGIALVASSISVRADDTLEQAAARAALEQKMRELDHPEARLSPNTNSGAAVATPVEFPINTTGTLTTNAAGLQAAPVSSVRVDAAFTPEVPAANASAQTAALAALKQKMYELNHPELQPPPDTNSVAAVATNPVATPANEASAAATPVTETPTAEAPMAISPVIASPVVAPLSTAPAVVAPAPKVSIAPAAAASVAAPTRTQPAATPTTPKLPASSPEQARPTNELVTTTGTIYKNVEVERVTADGIVISFTPANGEWATTKIYFQDLPAEIRLQYGK